MGFDAIPEDREQSFSCPICDLGEVTFMEEVNKWVCNKCDFEKTEGNK